MNLGNLVTKNHLKRTLGRAAAELRSKGTIDDPAEKELATWENAFQRSFEGGEAFLA